MKPIFIMLVFCLSLSLAQAQFSYVNPLPGSEHHNPQTSIILRNGQFIDNASVANKDLLQITGSISGNHSWTARLSDDRKTVVVHPFPEFSYGETVSVTVNSKLRHEGGEQVNGTSFTFSTRNAITAEEHTRYKESSLDNFIESFGYDPTKKMEEEQFETPDSFPTFVINVNNNPAPGRIFYCNQQELEEDDFNSFPTIIENDGTLVFARDEAQSGHDFKLNKTGYLSFFQYANTWWKIVDSNYNEIDSVRCGNGYETETNGHDFQMLQDGHYFVIAFNHQTIDMTAYGGTPMADVQGLIVQELDATKEVIFEWRSWDHFLFTDANQWTPLTNTKVDYVHGNAVERDVDGNLLISCRNMDEITKINRETGAIMWRMGGENNQFAFVNDNIPKHFSEQHDVRRIANGNITILNNGNYLPTEISSAKEYQLDEVNKVATLIWFYEHPDVNGNKVYARASGNVQRLPNGNTMISWGTIVFEQGIPNMTEVDQNKNIVWEMTFDEAGQKSYRVFKFDWNPCSRVSGFTMKAIKKPEMMILNWQPATGAISYLVRYRPLGSSVWQTKTIKSPKIKILGLLPGTTYEWNLKTICHKNPIVASAYSETKTFITQQKLEETIAEQEQIRINVYPVPANDHLTIDMTHVTEEATVVIRNLLGQVMYEKKVAAEETVSFTVDVATWTKGLYMVEIKGTFTPVTRKIIVE
ncbi:MAG: arylsulfotransferase family protein [Chitinophagales bacterium]